MEEYLPWIIVTFIGIVVFWIWASVRSASGDRRYAADMAAKATAIAAKEAARATIESASLAEAGKRERAGILGCIGALAAIAIVVVFAVVAVQGIQEAGKNRRYQTRHDTLIELDFGRTVRHLATQETMREKAWADAYGGQRRGPSLAQSLLLFFLGALVMFGSIILWANRSSYSGPSRGP